MGTEVRLTMAKEQHQWTDDEKAAAIDHLCEKLEEGLQSANTIMADMTPRLSKQTLHRWRAADEDIGRRIDEAFEIGCDRMAENGQKVADGVTGFSSKNVKRDRLKLFWMEKQLQVRNTRYRHRTVHQNDPDNPMPSMAPQFIIQPVQPDHGFEDGPSSTPETWVDENEE